MIYSNLISRKRDGFNLKKNDVELFFNGYLIGKVTDAQMSAMLMAIYFNGMDEDEIFSLVEVMLRSGKTLDFSDSKDFVADKHSTGGVGDKVSLILAPIGARMRDTLSPTPPVECLSATKSLESEKSSVFPDLSITSTSENISSSSIPLKYIAISIADIWASVTLPIRYPLKNSSTSFFFRLKPSRFLDIRFE